MFVFIFGFAITYGLFTLVLNLFGSALRPDIAPDKTKPVKVVVRKRVVQVQTQELEQSEGQSAPVRKPRPALPELV